MFRMRSEAEYHDSAESGVRHLFHLGPFRFHDTMDAEDRFHHFVLEASPDGEEVAPLYEVDRETMYEFMARYLAGEYEKSEYDLERSPGHDALLDLLELATARARSGETEFSLEELEHGETEVMDDPVVEDDEDGPEGR